MKYPNGEEITKENIQDEPWYYTEYQPLMELCIRMDAPLTVERVVEAYKKEWLSTFGVPYTNEERLLRWATLHVEITRGVLCQPEKRP